MRAENVYASAYSIGSSNGRVMPLAPEWSEWELFDSCDDECVLFLNRSPKKLIFGWWWFANVELVDGSAVGRIGFVRVVDLDGRAYKCDGSKFLIMGFLGRGDAT